MDSLYQSVVASNSSLGLTAALSHIPWSQVAAAGTSIYFIRFIVRSILNYKAASAVDVPGVFFPLGVPWRFLLPSIPWINDSNRLHWTKGFDKYIAFGSPIVKITGIWATHPSLHIASSSAAKQISLNRKVWEKPLEFYGVLSFFGKNLVITEGQEWKLHRRIVGPSFSEGAYKLVWDETLAVYSELIAAEGWGSLSTGETAVCKDMVDVTMRLALIVISRAAFNIPMPWKDDTTTSVPEGYTMTASAALRIATSHTKTRIITPKWAYKFPSKHLRTIDAAFRDLEGYMHAMLRERKAAYERGEPAEKKDLFNSLVIANADGEGSLGDEEVIGNVFIFLLAGHETSGHTLGFALALLALHPTKQAFLHTQSILLPPSPSYASFSQQSYALAVLYETMRLFAPVSYIPKRATEDTWISYTPIEGGEGERLFVPKGTDVMLDVPGIHMNPTEWENPKDFLPERFLGDWNKDAFFPFSAGPRACIGRRFSEVESVALLVLLIRDFEVSVTPAYDGEPWEEMEARLLRAKEGITLTPWDVKLTLKRRAKE